MSINSSETHFDLTGKVAIVVGATKGMGDTISRQFVAGGAKVMLNSRNQSEADALAAELNSQDGPGEAAAHAGDMTVKADLSALVDATVERFGKLTTLVLSPTIRPWFGASVDMPDDEIDTQFLYVFKCRFWATTLCVPHMVAAGGGSVIYIGSGSAFEATSERSVYAAMRAAEVRMMTNFAAEFGPNNVRFNVISPGLIDAHGSKSLFADPAAVERTVQKMPMRRHGTTAEISNAATFLASDASSFTTGTVLSVDGGRNIHHAQSNLTATYSDEQTNRLGSS